MARTIAIGDVHGCRRALGAVLEALRPERDDTLVMLGDYIDRGPDSRGVVDELLQVRQSCGLVALRGNHELMLLAACVTGLPSQAWLMCGGRTTLSSYGGRLAGVPDEHLDFLWSLRPHHQTETAILVHAGYAAELEMHEQADQVLYWDHLCPTSPPPPHHSGKTVFVGHTPQPTGQPLDLGHLICIDTHCCGGRFLTAIDVDSRETWQADPRGQLRRSSLHSRLAGYREALRHWKPF